MRCCLKPLKRWSYRKGRAFTRDAARRYFSKYLIKYLRKQHKLHESAQGSFYCVPTSQQQPLCTKLSDLLAVSARMKEVASGITSFAEPLIPLELEPSELRLAVVKIIERSIAMSTDGGSRTSTSDEAADEDKQLAISQLADYSLGLRAAIAVNAGFDHSKVREYWIYRGPRVLALALLAVIMTLITEELIIDTTKDMRRERLLVALWAFVILLATAMFMLYRRLPDAIYATVSRSAHDYYTQTKRSIQMSTSCSGGEASSGNENNEDKYAERPASTDHTNGSHGSGNVVVPGTKSGQQPAKPSRATSAFSPATRSPATLTHSGGSPTGYRAMAHPSDVEIGVAAMEAVATWAENDGGTERSLAGLRCGRSTAASPPSSRSACATCSRYSTARFVAEVMQ